MKYFFQAIISLCIILSCKSSKDNEASLNFKKGNHVLSSRFFHPRGINDIHSTVKAIQILKPKRIDWIYCNDEKILNLYKKYNLPFSLAINPQCPDSLGYTTSKFRIHDYKGEMYVAPWMKNWKQKNPNWGCVNNPFFYDLFLSKTKKMAKLGAYAIFVDDALFNIRLKREKKVGCFCKFCESLFNSEYRNKQLNVVSAEELKKALKINQGKKIGELLKSYECYENFQENSVVKFFLNWQKEIRYSYPKMVFLTNNFNGEWNEVYKLFDGGICELKERYINKNDLDSLYQLSDSLHKSQIFTIDTEDKLLQERLFSYNLKNNRTALYPWDIMIVKKNRRYYMPLHEIVRLEKQYNKK